MKKENIDKWMDGHPASVSVIVSCLFLAFGLLMMIGAILNWNWLYEPDIQYRSNWSLGQISRYIGRGPARLAGFLAGLLGFAFGVFAGYLTLMSILGKK